MMRPRHIVALLSLLAAPLRAQQPATPLELDHILLLVPPRAEAGVAKLRAAGLSVANEPTRHTGQGTASIGVLFDNAYLELLWIDSTVRRDASNALDIGRWKRVPTASRVGIGLRRVGVPAAPPPKTDAQGLPVRMPPRPMPDPGVPSRRYAAPWMPPNTGILLLRQPAESLAAELFVVQDEIALPWWVGQVRHEATILLMHPGKWQRVRRVIVHGPATQVPAAFARVHPARVEMRTDTPSASSWVEVEFEAMGAPPRTVDLRPTLPLVLRRQAP